MKTLNNKNILFISVSFFSYEKLIKKKLEERGANVDFFDERPSNSIFVKGLIRIKRDVYTLQIKNYYDNILKNINCKSYDFFLLIKGEVIPLYFIKKLKELNPSIVMIYYNFDSFYNNPKALDFLELFNKKFTFDTEDAVKYKMQFRPLFYSDDYKKLRMEKKDTNKKFDISFIGTAHSDRYLISESVKIESGKLDLKHFAYYYSQGKMVYFYKKIFDNSFKKFDYKKLSFISLTHEQIINIYRNSDYILDINHPGQKGLTMRTFETLGSGKKLITTNKEIQKYKIYHSGNILILDRDNVRLNPEFFDKPVSKFDDESLYAMSLDGWIDDLFFLDRNIDYWL